MKKLFLLFSVIFFVIGCAGQKEKKADPFASPVGFINDFDGLLTMDQILSLDSLIKVVEQKTTAEIAVITFPDSSCTVANFDSLTLAIAQKWGVGKKDKNNGIVIGLCHNKGLIRVQNGLGIELLLTNEETQVIIDQTILPNFVKGNYFLGLRDGIIAIAGQLE